MRNRSLRNREDMLNRWLASRTRRWLMIASCLMPLLALLPVAFGQGTSPHAHASGSTSTQAHASENTVLEPQPVGTPNGARVEVPDVPGGLLTSSPKEWTSPEGLSSTLQVMLLLTVISLAPAALLMTTCFVRIVVVLGILRQAIGTQQLPPSQVITTLALFMSLLLMTPVWSKVYDDSIAPYTNHEINLEQAWERGQQPIRDFMVAQIEATQNSETVWLFLRYIPDAEEPETYDDVPLQALLPAFMLSELKTAFLIGFQIYIPFLILDIVIASVTISMGMLMLPPVLISLPFKLLLFVLVDGWHLIVGMLLESFQPFY